MNLGGTDGINRSGAALEWVDSALWGYGNSAGVVIAVDGVEEDDGQIQGLISLCVF